MLIREPYKAASVLASVWKLSGYDSLLPVQVPGVSGNGIGLRGGLHRCSGGNLPVPGS
jgi:hypothetical protein